MRWTRCLPLLLLLLGARAAWPCQLTYRNGALIQNVKVVDVFYSPGHTFKGQLEDFYRSVTASGLFDWLVEYNVGSYKIGRGSFVSSVEDSNANPATLTKLDPEPWLRGLLMANKLPKPDDDTLYMLYFPSNIDPTPATGGSSCVSGGSFCAYHSAFVLGGQRIRYGVMPDLTAGKCATGCGGSYGFPAFSGTSTHELIEAVTDPDPNSGWYDDAAKCGEISDICSGMIGMVNGFVVSKQWSNKRNACIDVDASSSANAFSLGSDAKAVDVAPGGSATVQLKLTKSAGAAENVTFSTSGATGSLSVGFAPASASSDGGTTTATITAAANASLGSTSLTIKASGASSSATVTVAVNVVASTPDMAPPGAGTGGSSGGSGPGGAAGGGPDTMHLHSTGCSLSATGAAGGRGSAIAVLWMAAALLLTLRGERRGRS